MNWNDLWAAFALYLVLEGVLPFLNPGAAPQEATWQVQQSLTGIGAGQLLGAGHPR